MTAGPPQTRIDTSPATCCICAQSSTEGTRDKAGRFVCAGCLELARQAIIARRARAVRARENQKLEAEVAKVESDNSLVLEIKSALDPAFALLCPSCGRLLHIDVGACHACGYGLGMQAPPSRFSFMFRSKGPRPPVAPHLIALDAAALHQLDPRLEATLPWLLAAILWTASALSYWNRAARTTADVLAAGAAILLTAWLLAACSSRGTKPTLLVVILAVGTIGCALVDPVPDSPWIRWVAMTACLFAMTAFVFTRVRGVFVALWVVTLLAMLAQIIHHITR